MQRDFVESLLRSGIIEAKAGDKGVARRYLERAINASSDHTTLAELITGQNGILEGPVSDAPKSGNLDWLKDILED